jgi:hypothetical protein
MERVSIADDGVSIECDDFHAGPAGAPRDTLDVATHRLVVLRL